MQRKPLYLVASAAETARFFALPFLALALGGLKDSAGSASFFRYAAGAQLLFVAGFFFLWLDRPRYDAFRSLLFLGKIVSVVSFLPLLLELLFSSAGRAGMNRSGVLAALIVSCADIFGFFVLLVARPFSGPGGGPRDPSTSDGAQPPLADPGQGPDEIEGVEA